MLLPCWYQAPALAGVVEKHFKEKLPRVLGLGNGNPEAASMTSAIRGLMFGDYMVPGMASGAPTFASRC